MTRRIKQILGFSAAFAALIAQGSANGQAYQSLAGAPAAQASSGARQSVVITRGRSAAIDFPIDIRIGGATDPRIADVRMVTSRRAVIMGMGYGQTDAQFYDANGRVVMSVDVRVEQDISALDQAIARVVPTAQISTQSVNDNIILSGTVANAAEADKAVQMASIFADSPEKVRNFLTILGNDQVMLKIQVVEVDRTAIKQLGFNTNVFGEISGDQFLVGNTPGYAINGGFQGGFSAGLTGIDTDTGLRTNAQALIQAFERQGLVRTLAEPNLTAVSGQAAKFLAGGEYPVPSGRDAAGNIAIEFKPYGVGLGFTPVVLSDGRISLTVSTEVSELTAEGALTLTGFAGLGTSLVIPALTVRRLENTVELPAGGSIMLAGLLKDDTRQNLDKVPGIADMPVFGALARSRDFVSKQSELVIIASVYLVHPTARGNLQTPADGLHIASDLETMMLGKMNSTYEAAPEATAGLTYEGPFGHVID